MSPDTEIVEQTGNEQWIRERTLELYFRLIEAVNAASDSPWVPTAEATVEHLDVISRWVLTGELPPTEATDERKQA